MTDYTTLDSDPPHPAPRALASTLGDLPAHLVELLSDYAVQRDLQEAVASGADGATALVAVGVEALPEGIAWRRVPIDRAVVHVAVGLLSDVDREHLTRDRSHERPATIEAAASAQWVWVAERYGCDVYVRRASGAWCIVFDGTSGRASR